MFLYRGARRPRRAIMCPDGHDNNVFTLVSLTLVSLTLVPLTLVPLTLVPLTF
jgi:hypothetical protein